MEQDIKQHTMVFGKGITNTPSDLLCDDDSLEVCDGLTLVNGEWKPIQMLEPMFDGESLGGKLWLVHEANGVEKYIYSVVGSTQTQLKYKNEDGTGGDVGTFDGSCLDVKSVGNTLIVNTSNGILYYLWSEGIESGSTYTSGYKSLGSSLPDFKISFCLKNSVFGLTAASTCVQSHLSCDQILVSDIEKGAHKIFVENGKEQDAANVVIGLYSENKKKIAKNKMFCNPFLVTAAIEMYDGSYTMMSVPTLMLPALTKNSFIHFRNSVCYMRTNQSSLHFKLDANYDDWSDIVKNIVIFCTDDIDIYDTNLVFEDENYPTIPYYGDLSTAVKVADGVVTTNDNYSCSVKEWKTKFNDTDFNYPPFKERAQSDIISDIKSSGVFYKLCEIGTSGDGTTFKSTVDFIKPHALENLTTQTRLDTLEYFSRCKKYATDIYTFNRRLNIVGAKRSFFKGFESFLPLNDGSGHFYTVTVKIKTPYGVKEVVNNFSSLDVFYDGMWFYYPDPRAFHVTIKQGTTQILDKDLEEHSGLNGACTLTSLPTTSTSADTKAGTASYTIPEAESLPNYLLQSDVDNPFTFNSSGYIRVGQGQVIGMAGLTTALNQDAYKVATTLAFTTQGIWALQIDAEGKYAQVPPPFSREVCSNPKSITMTDNAVFFVSKKGLMCVTGASENGIVCVSEQLRGKGFKDFYEHLENAIIAFDYKDSLLYIIKYDGEETTSNSWVYNIKANMWSRTKSICTQGDDEITNSINNYPDCIIQDVYNKCYSAINKKSREEDTHPYPVYMTSRWMKFEGSLILKSIRQIKHLLNMEKSENGKYNIELDIYATNTLPLDDSLSNHKLNSVRGKAWRFFKFKYTMTTMKATDSFIGTTVVTQTKHTDRVR